MCGGGESICVCRSEWLRVDVWVTFKKKKKERSIHELAMVNVPHNNIVTGLLTILLEAKESSWKWSTCWNSEFLKLKQSTNYDRGLEVAFGSWFSTAQLVILNTSVTLSLFIYNRNYLAISYVSSVTTSTYNKMAVIIIATLPGELWSTIN